MSPRTMLLRILDAILAPVRLMGALWGLVVSAFGSGRQVGYALHDAAETASQRDPNRLKSSTRWVLGKPKPNPRWES